MWPFARESLKRLTCGEKRLKIPAQSRAPSCTSCIICTPVWVPAIFRVLDIPAQIPALVLVQGIPRFGGIRCYSMSNASFGHYPQMLLPLTSQPHSEFETFWRKFRRSFWCKDFQGFMIHSVMECSTQFSAITCKCCSHLRLSHIPNSKHSGGNSGAPSGAKISKVLWYTLSWFSIVLQNLFFERLKIYLIFGPRFGYQNWTPKP